MVARCTGKTDLHNLEPEDLRADASHPRRHRRPAGGQALGTRHRSGAEALESGDNPDA